MVTAQNKSWWRRGWWVPAVALVALLASGTWLATQEQDAGWGMGSGWGWGSGSRSADFGMMGGSGYDGMMGDYGWSGEDAEPVEDMDQARDRAAEYAEVVQAGLEVGEVMRFENHYYADLQEPDGTKVTEVLIDPRSGVVRPEMGPATMWNTRAAIMDRSGGSEPEVTAVQAQQIADDWLAQRDAGLTSQDPALFPGYYTLHTVEDGEITGMLSVHASTGDVWFHSWHDDFVEMSEHA